MADLRRRRRLDQQIVKIRINASEVEAGHDGPHIAMMAG